MVLRRGDSASYLLGQGGKPWNDPGLPTGTDSNLCFLKLFLHLEFLLFDFCVIVLRLCLDEFPAIFVHEKCCVCSADDRTTPSAKRTS